MSLPKELKKSGEKQLGDLNAALIQASVSTTDNTNMDAFTAMFRASLQPMGDLLAKHEAEAKKETGARPKRRRFRRGTR